MLAELFSDTVARKAGAQDHNGGVFLIDHRFFVMGRLVDGLFLQQLEVFLAYAAVGAQPVLGNVLPLGAGRDAVIRPAFLLVVHQATDNTFPSTHCYFSLLQLFVNAANPMILVDFGHKLRDAPL